MEAHVKCWLTVNVLPLGPEMLMRVFLPTTGQVLHLARLQGNVPGVFSVDCSGWEARTKWFEIFFSTLKAVMGGSGKRSRVEGSCRRVSTFLCMARMMGRTDGWYEITKGMRRLVEELVFFLNASSLLVPWILCRASERTLVGYWRFSKKDNMFFEASEKSDSSEQILLVLKSCEYGMDLVQDLGWLDGYKR